jgi:hypothetical protein
MERLQFLLDAHKPKTQSGHIARYNTCLLFSSITFLSFTRRLVSAGIHS